MKLIHTSDLHLGKRVSEFSMLDDQRYILDQIFEICVREQADALLLAGDLYDRQVPSAEAVQLLDRFLTRFADAEICVIAVSGNHDSAERNAFGAELMKSRGVYLSPVYNGEAQEVTLTDAYGPVHIWMLPFVRPSLVRHALKRDNIETYQDAVRAAVEEMKINPGDRNVLVAHQFVTGAGRCDSEEVAVGGVDNVDASVFEPFDYTALGHIHSPQWVGRETLRYCGTPLKYSVSEAGQEKSVTKVCLGEKGAVTVTAIPLKPLQDLRTIRGTYLEVTSRSFYQESNQEDYVQVTLTDEEDVPDAVQKLRVIYPNLLGLSYDNRRTRENRQIGPAEEEQKKTDQELFEEFYELQNNQPMSQVQQEFIMELFAQIKGGGR